MATAEVISISEQVKDAANQLEIVVNRKELVTELAAAVGVVETKTTIPILANLLLDASNRGDSVRIAATNLSQSLKTSIDAKIKAPGIAAIPARKLYDYVRLLSGDDVTIRQEENNHVQIRCGRSKTRMVGMSAASFPQIPSPDGWGDEFDGATFLKFIEKTLVSVAREEGRYTLNGALLIVTDEAVEMVSTDGHRLTRIRKTLTGRSLPARKLLISRAALLELQSLLKGGASSVRIAEDGKHQFFQVGYRTLASAKLAGTFPNYEAVIPKGYAPGIMLDVPSVAQSLNRCLLFADEKSRQVRFSIAEKTLEFSSAAVDLGETKESIDILGGPKAELAIGYNGEYIRDLLAMVPSHLEFQFKDNDRPALFTHRTDDGITLEHVVMPMRLGGK